VRIDGVGKRHRTTAAEAIAVADGTAVSVTTGINEIAPPQQGLAEGHIHLPAHRDVERLAAAVRRRIDLPLDGLRNVRKPAIWRLALLRLTGDEIQTKTRLSADLDVGITVRKTIANRAVLISRKSSLVALVAGTEQERDRRRRSLVVPGDTNLEAAARTIPRDVYCTPKTPADPEE
jgi:hypothetical protein